MVAPLRIVYFGTPQFAVPTLQHLLDSPHVIVGVVTQPDRQRGRGQKVSASPVKALALAHRLQVFQPEKLKAVATLDTLRGWEPDLGVVAAYGRIIPDEMLAIPRLGMINVHASLLPKYRGAAPVHRAVIDGEAETGVTIMRVVHELDAGNMIAKVKRPIGEHDTSDVVERDLAERGAALLVDVVNRLADGPVDDERQDFMIASYAPKLTKEEAVIDWTLPALYIHNRVRGLYPWPHAHTYLDGVRVIVLKTRVEDEDARAEPGTIVTVSRDAIHVAAGHESRLAINELQLEGKRPMQAREFLAGRPLQPGARFTGP